MEKLETIMRDTAKHLLTEGKVELVIGYAKGTVPLRTTPIFITKPDDVQQLVWNSCCDYDLVAHLLKPEMRTKNVGIVVKGCDARALVVCMNEGQIEREKTVIIGMPCQGMINRKKIQAAIGPKEILEAKVTEDKINLKGKGWEKTLPKKEYLQGCCEVCTNNNPPVYDVLVGGQPLDKAEETQLVALLEELEAKSADERWDYFANLLKDCIRCYACRNACPVCYCKECFVDQIQPQWVNKTVDQSDVFFYHIIRAFHVAGRCVECGACTRACPMNIDLRVLTRKLQKIVKDRFDFEAGLDIKTLPPMGTHKMDDAEEFITEPE